MNRDRDFGRFTAFMISLGKATPQGVPDPQKIEIYFRLLEDMPIEVIEKNAMEAVRRKGFFPMIPEIRHDPDVEKQFELEAQESYRILEDTIDAYYHPGFGESSCTVIEMKLKERGRTDLIPQFYRWGKEIANGQNPTATRAQFLKTYKAEMELLQAKLPAAPTKRLPGDSESIGRILEPMGDERWKS